MDDKTRQTILLIDDDTSLLTVLGDFLKHERYNVLTANSGEQGLRHLAATVPDLIILDISMPGMGGIQFLKEIRSRADIVARAPVLVFTARANTESFFENVNAAGFLAKPCEPTRLLKEIQRILTLDTQAEEPAAQSHATPRRVLVAEDDPDITDRIVRAFVNAGYEVDTVSKGPNVLEKTIVWRPDVILLKLILPNMNGDRVAAMLQEMPTTRTIPIVLYDDSGAGELESRYTRAETGIKRALKTSDPTRLVDAVRQL